MTTRLNITSPQDMAVAAPILLGFKPEDSVVMLGLAGARPFHARLGLPTKQGDIPDVVAELLRPAQMHGLAAVAFLFYTPVVRNLPARLSKALYRAFMDSGIEVVETLRVHDNHVWPQPPITGPSEGAPFDAASHPFTAEAVADGRVTAQDRNSLSDRLLPVPDLVAGVEAIISSSEPLTQAELAVTFEQAVSDGFLPTDLAARVVRSLAVAHMGGAAILHAVRRSNGMQALRFFSWLVQRTPASYEPEVLACVALTAWLAGDGAFSWTAVDRCKELRPGTTLVRSIEPLLANAVPPQMWDEVVKA